MFRHVLFFLILLSANLWAADQPDPRSRYPAGADWESRYQEVCAYDKFCTRLKNNGGWAFPLPAIRSTLESLAPTIREAAALYGVDPRAVVASILCEDSINVTVEDQLQTFLVASHFLPSAKVLGNGFSVGLGQLYCDRAQSVERPPRG